MGYEDAASEMIDVSEPLAAQVGALRGEYLQWIHQPMGGKPRLFRLDWMELLSKTPWFVVPCVWVPIALACITFSYLSFKLSTAQIAWRAIAGVLVWHFTEYSLHRFVFHNLEPVAPWLVTLHFLMHGMHHKYPHDDLRLVFPLVPAFWLALIFVTIARSLLTWQDVTPCAAGIILGYVNYDCTHYFIHTQAFKSDSYFGVLRKYHMAHHFLDHAAGFGISTSFWDHVMLTFRNEHTPPGSHCSNSLWTSGEMA